MAGAKAQKRKSVENQTPGKKIKLENGSPKKPFVKKENDTPFVKKENDKPFVKKENGSPQKQGNKKNKGGQGQKPKPFAGTKQLNYKPKIKKEKGVKNENNAEEKSKKKRAPQFHKLKAAVTTTKGQSDPDVVKSLEEKIKSIEARDQLSKTAKRKLAMLKKLKATAEGTIIKPKEEKTASKKVSTSKARRERKKNATKEAKAAGKQKPAKQVKKEEEDSDDDEDDDEAEDSAEAESSGEESGDEEAGEEEDSDDDDDEDAGEEVEGEADSDDDEDDAENGDNQDDDDDDDEEDDSDDDEQPAPKEKQQPKKKNDKEVQKRKPEEADETESSSSKKSKSKETPKQNQVNLENLKKKDIIGKNQKRYVLFVGNIPWDTTKETLKAHFSKAGEIIHIRLPLDQKSNKPRGFGYIEVKDEETYQKCLSMHHTQFQGRRINVLYTQGGKKNSENQKKDIKAKNMKLHALRRQGKLAGSTKENHKRTFRRNQWNMGKNEKKTDA